MSFNNKQYSNELCEILYELGIYTQPNELFAVSENLPRNHVENKYIVLFETFYECLSFLESELESKMSNFLSIIESIKSELENIDIKKPNHEQSINDDLIFSALNELLKIVKNHEELSDIENTIIESKNNIFYMSDLFRKKIIKYSVLIQIIDAEILGENQRLLILQHIYNNNNESKIKDMLKFAQMYYGMEEGIGPKGRNSPLTPFGGYDYWYDRVMDGTDLHDRSGGHATEKFLGTSGYNRFKRYPDLLKKTKLKQRIKPYRFISNEKRRKLRSNKRKNKNNSVKQNGLIVNSLEVDPTYYTWWDERKNPYLWSDREDNSGYPSWSSYR